jgi:5'-3' exoribonuclease 2
MGIPTFFRTILQRNRKVLQGARKNILQVDYFYLDFNSIVYNVWHKLSKTIKPDTGTIAVQDLLIEKVVEQVRHMIKDIVCPVEYTYISIDGTAPRAKSVQQRSRRYKSIQLKSLFAGKTVSNVEFDPSPNITPGTVFMQKLSRAIQKMMARGDCGYVLLSDASIPGEGEHKFLPRIKNMVRTQTEKDKTVVIYSPDGDMISLGMLTHKNNIYIMRIPDEYSEVEKPFAEDYEFIYCSLDIVRTDFYKDLTKTYQDTNIDELKILTDYNFLLFMAGNDFVPSLHFLKIRSGGMKMLITIYNELRQKYKNYLVDYDVLDNKPPRINMEFFTDIVWMISLQETKELRAMQSMIHREQRGLMTTQRSEKEANMSADEMYCSRLEHVALCNPDNPLQHQYRDHFKQIDYFQDKHVWKMQFYKFFMDADTNDIGVYNQLRTRVVHNYFQSLMFTLYYYLNGCPSWTWCYRYRISPLFSDMHSVLTKHRYNLNTIQFTKDVPYTPYQQLMFILPPQMSFLLPAPLALLMKEKYKDDYPDNFEVDAANGIKYIYSEAILPELDENQLLTDIRRIEETLPRQEKERNAIKTKIISVKQK